LKKLVVGNFIRIFNMVVVSAPKVDK